MTILSEKVDEVVRKPRDWYKLTRKTDERCYENPQVGDLWHDRFRLVMCILDKSDNYILICNKSIHIDNDHYTIDLKNIEWILIKDFQDKLKYKNEDNFLYHVSPRRVKFEDGDFIVPPLP